MTILDSATLGVILFNSSFSNDFVEYIHFKNFKININLNLSIQTILWKI